MRTLIRVVIALQLVLAGLLAAVPAISSQTSPHSVAVTASPQQVFPGGTVTVTVNMFTALDNAREVLEVFIPNGMTVVPDSPTCAGACESAGVAPGGDSVSAILDVGSYEPNPQRSATLTFTAIVSMDAAPGSSLTITAYLGSPAASDTVSIFVEAAPEAPEAELYFDISPRGVVVGPNGVFTILAYAYVPHIRGLPRAEFEEPSALAVTATLPEGLVLDSSSGCVYLDSLADNSLPDGSTPTCSLSTSVDDVGGTNVTLVIPSDERSIGILLRVTNTGLEARETTSVDLTLEDPSGKVGVGNPFTSIDVFALESLATMGADTSQGSMNVLVVSEENSCTASQSQGTKLALAEWGGGSILSTAETEAVGDVGGLQELEDRCTRLVAFQDVPPLSLYLLGVDPAGQGMGDTFCRTCVLGQVPWAENSIPIITDNPYD